MYYMDRALRALQLQVDPLQRFVELFAASLDQPELCQFNGHRGFRYEAPDVRHFCLLKAARTVSALNACIELARGGYTQEIGTLIRTIAEFVTHIEFVLDPGEEDRSNIEKYVQEFFADSRRDPAAEIKRAQARQAVVHESLGRRLDDSAKQGGDTGERSPAEALYSTVYRGFRWLRLSEQNFRVDKWICAREIPGGYGYVRRDARTLPPSRDEGNA